MLTGYQARAEVDEFICGIDGGVIKECSKREVRYSDRFWDCGSCVGGESFGAVVTIAHAAAASVTAAVLTLAKVF